MGNNVVTSAGTGDGAPFSTLELSSGPTGGSSVQHPFYLLGYTDGTAGGTKFVNFTTPLPIVSRGMSSSVTLTRTADTSLYAANDIVGSATGSTAGLTFALTNASAGEFVITSAELLIRSSGVISGETSYLLYLYNVTPPSASGDNAAWDLPSGDRASFLGYVSLGTPVDLGSTLYVQTDGINKQVTLASANIYAYLVTVGTYTPTSARVYEIKLHGFLG